ncbi:MAG: tetratricopeptide repeat protein [Patescibacteria group bacterium]|nr:tetratricopeptide repeat protein [Patescibacteria group bacterium]
MESDISKYRDELKTLIDSERYEEALEVIDKIEKKDSDNFEILSAKVSILGLMGEYENAINTADHAIEINAKDYEVFHKKGVSLYHLGRYEESISAFDRCLNLRPNFSRAIEKKISALTLVGRYKEAVDLYSVSDLPEQGYASFINNLGLAYLELGDYQKAEEFLHRARKMDGFETVIYYNLLRLNFRLKRYVPSFLYAVIFVFLFTLRKLKALRDRLLKTKPSEGVSIKKSSGALIFKGPGKLFASDSQKRETQAILKLLRGPNFWALCNDTFTSVAINIPYQAVEQNGFNGDIDILVGMPKTFPPDENTETRYRGFQVKTITVDKNGKISSAKRGRKKQDQIKKQLDVLKEFGCEQIFLLELFVIERGYSKSNRFPPQSVVDEINSKVNLLKNGGFGYVIMIEEPSQDIDDESGGILYMPINILPTKNFQIKPYFSNLVREIENFYKQNLSRMPSNILHIPTVSYCKKCKKLTFLEPQKYNQYACQFCKKDIV